MRYARRRYVALLAAGALVVAGFLPSPFLAVSPGPTFALSDMVALQGSPAVETSIFMVTVAAREATWFKALSAALEPDVAVWTKEALWGGKSAVEYEEHMGNLMEESRTRALRLASRWASYPAEDDPDSFLSVEAAEVLGPSAGLAFALQLSSILAGEDLAGGLPTAATGVLDDSGGVAAVGGIAQKAISCAESGIEVFLVPKANYAEASKNANGVTVIGVGSLEEAINALLSMPRSTP